MYPELSCKEYKTASYIKRELEKFNIPYEITGGNIMSDINKAFAYIDSKAEEMKKLWIDISKIESPSEHKLGVDAVTELLADTCKKNGLYTKIITFENAGNSLVTQTDHFTEKNNGIVLMGHMDTVHKLCIFKEPIVFEKDDFLYGPGVFDCKGD